MGDPWRAGAVAPAQRLRRTLRRHDTGRTVRAIVVRTRPVIERTRLIRDAVRPEMSDVTSRATLEDARDRPATTVP